jgi:putative ABC transport system permease protein
MIGRGSLLIALRLLARNRVYAAINIGGLALGLAGCLLILSYVRYEASYDKWLPDSERIHQMQATWREPGQPVTRSQNSPETLARSFPDIEALSVLTGGRTVTVRGGEPIFIDVASVDQSFFDIFKLPFAQGSAERALPDTNSIVLTEAEAVKQFGTAEALGRTVSLGAGEGLRDYLVTGVLKDLPKNSSLKLALLFRYDPAVFDAFPADYKGWGSMNQQHYVKLRAGASAESINNALPAWEKRVIPPQLIGDRRSSQADILELKLTPIADVHLGDAQNAALQPGGDPRTLATFGIVALLTLAMAIINFVNLSTARATQRAREVALRKVLGATRRQLIFQFLGESLLLSGLALLLALSLVELATPWIGGWVDAELTVSYLGAGGMLLPASALLVLTGLAGGLYPAVYLSRFQPAAVLRASGTSAAAEGGRLAFRRQRPLRGGSARDAAGAGRDRRRPHQSRPRRNQPDHPGSAATGRRPARVGRLLPSRSGLFRNHGAAAARRPRPFRIGGDRIPGRDEAGGTARPAALARGVNVVVNRTAAAALGFASPQQAVGKTIGVGIDNGLAPATISGVVEDTRIRTARDALEPLIYGFDPEGTSQVLVRYAAARPGEVMDGLKAVWRRFEPEIPFQARFGDDILDEAHSPDRARAALFAVFTGLALIIACLGLYSLAAFATERRTKEIGIRKVLGAKVRHIVRLLTWQFSKPVVIANLLAWPAAWWAMRDWLNGFALRIDLTPGPFILAGAMALGIAIFTVAGHALRVARMNPIHALRQE